MFKLNKKNILSFLLKSFFFVFLYFLISNYALALDSTKSVETKTKTGSDVILYYDDLNSRVEPVCYFESMLLDDSNVTENIYWYINGNHESEFNNNFTPSFYPDGKYIEDYQILINCEVENKTEGIKYSSFEDSHTAVFEIYNTPPEVSVGKEYGPEVKLIFSPDKDTFIEGEIVEITADIDFPNTDFVPKSEPATPYDINNYKEIIWHIDNQQYTFNSNLSDNLVYEFDTSGKISSGLGEVEVRFELTDYRDQSYLSDLKIINIENIKTTNFGYFETRENIESVIFAEKFNVECDVSSLENYNQYDVSVFYAFHGDPLLGNYFLSDDFEDITSKGMYLFKDVIFEDKSELDSDEAYIICKTKDKTSTDWSAPNTAFINNVKITEIINPEDLVYIGTESQTDDYQISDTINLVCENSDFVGNNKDDSYRWYINSFLSDTLNTKNISLAAGDLHSTDSQFYNSSGEYRFICENEFSRINLVDYVFEDTQVTLSSGDNMFFPNSQSYYNSNHKLINILGDQVLSVDFNISVDKSTYEIGEDIEISCSLNIRDKSVRYSLVVDGEFPDDYLIDLSGLLSNNSEILNIGFNNSVAGNDFVLSSNIFSQLEAYTNITELGEHKIYCVATLDSLSPYYIFDESSFGNFFELQESLNPVGFVSNESNFVLNEIFVSRGGSSSNKTCRDEDALNYKKFGSSDPSLCEYKETDEDFEEEEVTEDETQEEEPENEEKEQEDYFDENSSNEDKEVNKDEDFEEEEVTEDETQEEEPENEEKEQEDYFDENSSNEDKEVNKDEDVFEEEQEDLKNENNKENFTQGAFLGTTLPFDVIQMIISLLIFSFSSWLVYLKFFIKR